MTTDHHARAAACAARQRAARDRPRPCQRALDLARPGPREVLAFTQAVRQRMRRGSMAPPRYSAGSCMRASDRRRSSAAAARNAAVALDDDAPLTLRIARDIAVVGELCPPQIGVRHRRGATAIRRRPGAKPLQRRRRHPRQSVRVRLPGAQQQQRTGTTKSNRGPWSRRSAPASCLRARRCRGGTGTRYSPATSRAGAQPRCRSGNARRRRCG